MDNRYIYTNNAYEHKPQNIEEKLERIFEHFPELREALEAFIIQVLATNQEDLVTTDNQRLDEIYAKLILEIINPSQGIHNLEIAHRHITNKTINTCTTIAVATIILTVIFNIQQIQYAIPEAITIISFALYQNIKHNNPNLPTYISLNRRDILIHGNQELATLLIEFYLAIQNCLIAQQKAYVANTIAQLCGNNGNLAEIRIGTNAAIADTLMHAGALIVRMQAEGLITHNGIDPNTNGINNDPLAQIIDNLPIKTEEVVPVPAKTSS